MIFCHRWESMGAIKFGVKGEWAEPLGLPRIFVRLPDDK
jgi:hypothetical protein